MNATRPVNRWLRQLPILKQKLAVAATLTGTDTRFLVRAFLRIRRVTAYPNDRE